ncbi:TIGR02678 family protein [Actinosynnema sp. NPDC049800]
MSAGSIGTEEHKAHERRLAARSLLMQPVLTAARHPEQLALVRKHSPQLKRMFTTMLGYQLVVEPTFARLLKAPLSADTVPRPALTRNDKRFTARTYSYLALVCASLLAPQTGDQVLMSALVEQARADAVTAGIALADDLGASRDLVRAVDMLVDWGVLTETDGSVAGWETRQEEALLDVHRPLLPHLLSRALSGFDSPAALLDGAQSDPLEPEQPRRSLRRKLVENPLVRREDLTDAERDVLSRERREVARVLDESFGLVLEARSEGVLAYDPDEAVSDVAFPGSGTVAHAALLLVNALTDEARPTAGDTATFASRTVPGVRVPWSAVEANIDLIIEQYGSAFAKGYVEKPSSLMQEAVLLLESVSIVVVDEDGLVLHPAAARYRPEPHRAPTRTRAMRRIGDQQTPTLFG